MKYSSKNSARSTKCLGTFSSLTFTFKHIYVELSRFTEDFIFFVHIYYWHRIHANKIVLMIRHNFTIIDLYFKFGQNNPKSPL